MHKKISYLLLLFIIVGVGAFIFVNNQKLKTKEIDTINEPSILTEEQRIHIIFKEEFAENQKPE